MITARELPGKTFTSKEDLFDALIAEKDSILAIKKAETKEADAIVSYASSDEERKTGVLKVEGDSTDPNKLQVKVVINSTNLLDSHADVHIKGIWKKSLRENKNPLLLQEHVMKFDHVISRNTKASTEEMTFKELGFKKLSGTTEALIFDATINRKDNPFMFDQYVDGNVKEHSVGMRYVKLLLAINSDRQGNEEYKENWDKYIDQVANRKDAETLGYFWPIIEAKIIEGSAVVKGSNFATPTLEVSELENKGENSLEDNEPPVGTQNSSEPTQVTHNKSIINFYKHLR